MGWKEFVRDYLRFSMRDRIAALALAISVIIIFLLPHFLPGRAAVPVAVTNNALLSAIEKSSKAEEKPFYKDDAGSTFSDTRSDIPGINYRLFYFDPNRISDEEWKNLGLRDKTIRTILNYRNKGGKFRTADDLRKIYGLREEEFNRLSAYIKIDKEVFAGQRSADPIATVTERKVYPALAARYASIDINRSDTSAWIALPGIGSKLASRIVSFREKLGGFYAIGQVAETFGLPDSTFQKIKPLLRLEPVEIKKININSATPDELKKHPYIRWALANAIIAYRNEHGTFKELEELKNIMAVTEDVYSKIYNYLTL